MPQEFSTRDAWLPDTITYADWGILHVFVAGRDVTFLRDTPVVIEEWASTEPFGDLTATIRLPALTLHDELGSALSGDDDTDLSMFEAGANVDIVLFDDQGNELETVWEGLIDGWEFSQTQDSNSGLRLDCIGALYQADYYVRAPTYESAQPHADLIQFQFDSRAQLHLRTNPTQIEGDPSEFETAYTGQWNDLVTSYLSDLLAEMVEADGSQWTIAHDRPRTPVLRKKDTTTVAQVYSASQYGFEARLRQDFAGQVNVVYGEGQDDAGATWRNAEIVGVGGNETRTGYDPVASLSSVHPAESNPDLDLTAIRRERFVRFPHGTSLAEAQTIAQRYVDAETDPGWIGDLTLAADGESGSRFALRAGQNIRTRYIFGTRDTGLIFHIAEARHRPAQGVTTLRVDTRARDRALLEALLERQRGNTLDRRLRAGSVSDTVNDVKPPWDVTGGMGFFPRSSVDTPSDTIFVPANTWVIFGVTAPTSSSVRQVEARLFQADGTTLLAAPFHLSFYEEEITPGELPDDAFAPGAWEFTPEDQDAAPWEAKQVRAYGAVLADGTQDRAGFWPGEDVDGDAATGVLKDASTWQFSLDNEGGQTLWGAVWTGSVEARLRGRIFQGVD